LSVGLGSYNKERAGGNGRYYCQSSNEHKPTCETSSKVQLNDEQLQYCFARNLHIHNEIVRSMTEHEVEQYTNRLSCSLS
jgi:hypothetical protein